MRNYLFGFLGAVVGACGVLAAWLFWPLPDARFDWRAYADDLSSSESCSELGALLSIVAPADINHMALYLSEASIGERCPAYLIPREGSGVVMAEITTDTINREIDYQRENQDWRPSHGRGFSSSYLFWSEARHARAAIVAWPDVVLSFRCIGPLEYGSDAEWYVARSSLTQLGIANLQIDAWDRRFGWCEAYARQQLETTGSSTPAELTEQYRRWADGWELLDPQ